MKERRHPKEVVGYDGSLKDLAQAIGQMSYDQVAVFIGELALDIKTQAEADLTLRKRKKLAKELFEAVDLLSQAQAKINSAWDICKPYMPVD